MLTVFLCLTLFFVVCGTLLFGFPVAFTLGGISLLFAIFSWMLGVFDLSFIVSMPQRIFATMTNEVLVAVPLFVFMGVMLERSKVAEELLENMGQLFGKLPGGLAFSVTIMGMLLAASTGIVGATVVTMGLLSLPTMLRFGYDKKFACGTIAASGTLGQIIPPSIVLILLGDQLSTAYQKAQFDSGIFSPDTVSVNDLFAGALLPGMLLVGMYLLYQIAVAFLTPHKAPSVNSDDYILQNKGAIKRIIVTLAIPLSLVVAVLGSILGGLATPTEAASVGSIGATMLAGYRVSPKSTYKILLGPAALVIMLILSANFDMRLQREVVQTDEMIAAFVAGLCSLVLLYSVSLALYNVWSKTDDDGERILASVSRSTVQISSMVFVILVGASMFSLVFRGLHGDVLVEEFLQALPGGTLGAVLLVMVVMFVMGFFLDFLEIVFIVVPIVSPILLQLTMPDGSAMSPVWLGVMMAINLQTSFLTPPFGFALFYLRGVAPPEVRTPDIYKGVLPFVMIQVLALVVLWYFPVISTWLPDILYN